MDLLSLEQELKQNSYPGRGIVIGKSEDGKYAVKTEKNTIKLSLEIDESICTMYEYFEIFLGRMMMCRGAAEMLGAKFKLEANGSKIL